MSPYARAQLSPEGCRDTGNGRSRSLSNERDGSSSAVKPWSVDERASLRAAADRLRPRIPNIDKLLRAGAVAMLERCEAYCAARGDAGDGMLAQLLLQGGPPAIEQPQRISERQRILNEMNAWQAGYPGHPDYVPPS